MKRPNGAPRDLYAKRQSEDRPDPDATYAVQPAAVADADDEAAIQEARRQSHDALIEGLGDKRRSGVQWLQWNGLDAIEMLDKHLDDGRQEWQNLRRYLVDHPRGALVIAMAQAEEPTAALPSSGAGS